MADNDLVYNTPPAEYNEKTQFQDFTTLSTNVANPKNTNPFSRFKKGMLVLLKSRTFKTTVLLIILSLATGAAVIPKFRYFVLNRINVKASSSFVVLDSTSHQPIKNAEVVAGNTSAKTDIEGRVILQNLKLGPQTIIIKKIAFGSVSKDITFGWGSNKLEDVLLVSTGVQYDFVIKDFLNKNLVPGVEVSYGESSAVSDNNGKAVLTVEKISSTNIEVTVASKHYRTDKYTLNTDNDSEMTIELVNKRKHLFVSERTGRPDLYSVYVDGKDMQTVLKASGSERNDQALIPSPSQSLVAYVSTRGNQKNTDGYLLSNLLLIDTETSQTTFIATSEQIYVLGWSGDWLVYVQVTAGDSVSSTDRHQLHSYNSVTGESRVIATANYLNNFVMINGYVFFFVNVTENPSLARLAKARPDSGDTETVFSGEVWNLTVTDYAKLSFLSGSNWYDYSANDLAPSKRASPVSDNGAKKFIDSGSSNQSLWLDIRDGMSTILLQDVKSNTSNAILEIKHASYPLSWLDETTVVYRLISKSETADYAFSTLGGAPVKISDVKNTSGIFGIK